MTSFLPVNDLFIHEKTTRRASGGKGGDRNRFSAEADHAIQKATEADHKATGGLPGRGTTQRQSSFLRKKTEILTSAFLENGEG